MLTLVLVPESALDPLEELVELDYLMDEHLVYKIDLGDSSILDYMYLNKVSALIYLNSTCN